MLGLPSIGSIAESIVEDLSGSEFLGDIAKTGLSYVTGDFGTAIEGLLDGGENVLDFAGDALGGAIDAFSSSFMDNIMGGIPSPSICECEPKGYSPIDDSMKNALAKLQGKNPITAEDILGAIKDGAGDFDGNAAGLEFKQLSDFVKANAGSLTPAAQEAFSNYENLAMKSMGNKDTGISATEFDNMVAAVGEIAKAEGASATSQTGETSGTSGTSGDSLADLNLDGLSLDEMIFKLLMACIKDKREELTTKAKEAKNMKSESQLKDENNGVLAQGASTREDAMQELQLSQNQLQQMNQLLTNMMSSIHQMNQAIIQNIR